MGQQRLAAHAYLDQQAPHLNELGCGPSLTLTAGCPLCAKGDSSYDVIKMLDAILTPATWLAFDLPVPESWLPGIEMGKRSLAWDSYLASLPTCPALC